jgi:hypothetical protein
MWVAILHWPTRHLLFGSGKDKQYFPAGKSLIRPQPSQDSMMGWQLPPLKEHPLLLMKAQGIPIFTVPQSMLITPLENFLKYSRYFYSVKFFFKV